MKIKTLYTRDTAGRTRQIDFHLEGNQYYASYGIVGGQFITDPPTVCAGKNKGKANETTPEQQAEKEVLAKIKKKTDTGYVEDLANLDVQQYFEPMLAHKWEDHKHKLSGNNFIYSQPKLDGVRCIVRWEGDKVVARSRNGKEVIPISGILDIISLQLPKNLVLDGELYNHSLKEDFNKIISLVRKTKPKPEDIEECEQIIEYHVYDIFDIDNPTSIFVDRYHKIKFLLEDNPMLQTYVKLVTTHIVAVPGADVNIIHDNLNAAYREYLEDGYEGQIIRLNYIYEQKRSQALLKRKEFLDDEFIITGVEEGKGKRAGQAILVLQTKDGVTFNGAIKGADELRVRIFNNPNDVIGKQAHVRFFEYTPDGVPRFPVVHSIRDYE